MYVVLKTPPSLPRYEQFAAACHWICEQMLWCRFFGLKRFYMFSHCLCMPVLLCDLHIKLQMYQHHLHIHSCHLFSTWQLCLVL